MSPQCAEADVMRLLARYFRDNPLACDTAEGAFRWWLPQETEISESMVVAALDALVQEGALETLSAADGRVRYRRVADPTAGLTLARIAHVPSPDAQYEADADGPDDRQEGSR
jgi:hypothetical protein